MYYKSSINDFFKDVVFCTLKSGQILSMMIFSCDVPDCDYKSKKKSHMTRHKWGVHGIGIPVWFSCDVVACEYKCKDNSHLRRHKWYTHDIMGVGYTWFSCKMENCDFKSKDNSSLKSHKWQCHDIMGNNCTWFHCDVELCDFKSKDNSSLKSHKWQRHEIGDKKFYSCDVRMCDYICKTKANLSRHRWHCHDIIGKGKCNTWFYCNMCNYKCKDSTSLKSHRWNLHNEGPQKWFICDVNGCEYKSKSSLTTHKWQVHEISPRPRWYVCDVIGCNWKFKRNTSLKSHKETKHDIGKFLCDLCLRNRNSQNAWSTDGNNSATILICRDCYVKVTGKESRIEKIWSDYLDEHIGTQFLVGSDTSMHSLGGCSLRRPDKLYASSDLVEVDECDEHQHKGENGDYMCDEKRITEIYDEPSISGKKMVVIRWNPDSYKLPPGHNGYKKQSRKERLEIMIKLKRLLRLNPPSELITVYYICYDLDNDRIVQNMPVKMIYSEEDLLELKQSDKKRKRSHT